MTFYVCASTYPAARAPSVSGLSFPSVKGIPKAYQRVEGYGRQVKDLDLEHRSARKSARQLSFFGGAAVDVAGETE
jgi:hypothetical protein